jgi:hypothetical protein
MRAREVLRRRLSRRGFAPAAALPIAGWAASAAQAAVPERLIQVAVGIGCRLSANPAADAVPEAVSQLAKGALKAMLLTRWKLAAAVVLASTAFTTVVLGYTSALARQDAGGDASTQLPPTQNAQNDASPKLPPGRDVGDDATGKLPPRQQPAKAPPAPATVQVAAYYPGANAETVRDTVAKPIEAKVSGVAGMLDMSSSFANDGAYLLTVTFKADMDPDMAQVLVQDRVSLAFPVIPPPVQNEGITVKKMLAPAATKLSRAAMIVRLEHERAAAQDLLDLARIQAHAKNDVSEIEAAKRIADIDQFLARVDQVLGEAAALVPSLGAPPREPWLSPQLSNRTAAQAKTSQNEDNYPSLVRVVFDAKRRASRSEALLEKGLVSRAQADADRQEYEALQVHVRNLLNNAKARADWSQRLFEQGLMSESQRQVDRARYEELQSLERHLQPERRSTGSEKPARD